MASLIKERAKSIDLKRDIGDDGAHRIGKLRRTGRLRAS